MLPRVAAHHRGAPEQVAGLDLELAPDHLVPGPVVAIDDDLVDVGLLVLGDGVADVDRRVPQLLLGRDAAVDVPFLGVGGVEALQRLVGVVGRVDGAGLQLDHPVQQVGGQLVVAGDGDAAHPVANALGHRVMGCHPVARGVVGQGIQRRPDLDVAVVLVQPLDPLLVVPQRVRMEAAAAPPGDHLQCPEPAAGLRFHRLDDLPGRQMVVALEVDSGQPLLDALGHGQPHHVALTRLDQGVGHFGAVVALLLVERLDVLPRVVDALAVEEAAGPDRQLLLDVLGLDLPVAQDLHPLDQGLLGHLEGQDHAPEGGVGVGGHVGKVSQAVDLPDRFRHQRRVVLVAGDDHRAVDDGRLVDPVVALDPQRGDRGGAGGSQQQEERPKVRERGKSHCLVLAVDVE